MGVLLQKKMEEPQVGEAFDLGQHGASKIEQAIKAAKNSIP